MRSHLQIQEGLDLLGLKASAGLVSRLEELVEELIKWNRIYNLTSITQPGKIVSHHILDSLAVQPYIHTDSIIDVGSGAGFPGLPLALYSPDQRFTLLDSSGKKIRFLQQMKISLELDNCQIVHERAEDHASKYDQIACRAFSSLAEITKKTAHLLSHHGEILALKGRLDSDEASANLDPFKILDIHKLEVPFVDAERHLVVMKRQV
ncbi:MAG: 16S rRNA (guanine(527)-N(7))-methyltransferase RsmG [Pseudomonadales bacterium]|nr:16S rRNA (guanine(527)-N(7))-methyltransferase RsmG [Pseudomonadales bacterium]